ncbi:hypothetical protein BM613_10975 [Sulfoacidibacillus thermotolerans]|uniref:Glycosyltransferase 2-like domain-containing protein n=2 Tax=Sulfoacidibacillus thermotolerans TaxID=1765684 RepID=A0A2U3D6T6_SULT2|nr:hypothetical protein BM613_10975 [Sulfoacidibacillus thermotolerans]
MKNYMTEIELCEYMIFGLSVGISLVYLLVPIFALRPRQESPSSDLTKNVGISLLIPCFNEETTVETTIEGLRQLNYSNFEVIFINDGSEDDTFIQLQNLLKLIRCDRVETASLPHAEIRGIYESQVFSNITVIDKLNGGKADSLNTAICYAQKEIVVSLDADSVLAPDALTQASKGMSNKNVIAGGGFVRVLQGSSPQCLTKYSFKLPFILKLQTLEYLRGFFLYKAVMGSINGILVIPGVFGLFRRDVMIEVGGYTKTIGEDMDITLKFHEWGVPRGHRIEFFPESICYTECPENWKDLYNQRIRWQKSLVDCVKLHWKPLVLHPSWVTFVLLLDSGFVNTFGPFSTLGIIMWALLWIHKVNLTHFTIIVWVLVGLLQTISALYINRRFGARYSTKDAARIFVMCLLEILYRLWNLYVIVIGTLGYFYNRNSWNKVQRTGRKYYSTARDKDNEAVIGE